MTDKKSDLKVSNNSEGPGQPDSLQYVPSYRLLVAEMYFRRADYRQKFNGILTRAGIIFSGNLALIGVILSSTGCYSISQIVTALVTGTAAGLSLLVLVVPSKPSITIPGLEQFALVNPDEAMFSKVLLDELEPNLASDEKRLGEFRLLLTIAVAADIASLFVFVLGKIFNV